MIILLRDNDTCDVDAVIITETSTSEDVTKTIEKVKAENRDSWGLDDILEALPKDCKAYSRYDGGLEESYY